MLLQWWRKKLIVLKVLTKYVVLLLWQKAYLPVVRVGRNVYEVHYVLKDRVYKVRTQIRRMPRVVRVLDHEGEDATECVLAYLGPNEDFHGALTTPGDLGYNGLLFRMRGGKEVAFAGDDFIDLDKNEQEN